MDERQTQIREQAGLTESKLNVEFIDFLRKWSTPVLLVVLAAALGVVVYQRVERARAAELGAAFRELEQASTGTPNPQSLKAIADTYSGVRGVAPLARLRAADEYLRAVRLGVRLGSQLEPGGKVKAEDALAEGDRASYLNEARALYQQVLDAMAPSDGKELHAIAAAFGLAAVAESEGKLDAAKAAYDRVVQLADRAGMAGQVEIAKRRAAELSELAQPTRMYTTEELDRVGAPAAGAGAAPAGFAPVQNAPMPSAPAEQPK